MNFFFLFEKSTRIILSVVIYSKKEWKQINTLSYLGKENSMNSPPLLIYPPTF